MSASKLGARSLSMLAVMIGAGCYSTTPHKAQVAAIAMPRTCVSAIADVFAKSGFVQLPTPPDLSMFFTARTSGPYSSFLRTGTGVGVKLDAATDGAGTCNVTIEALSPDVDCPDAHAPLACIAPGKGPIMMDPISGMPLTPTMRNGGGMPACPNMGTFACRLSYAPGEENDAAVDELARRVRVALGADAHVTPTRAP
jgi:hypothetical protein